MACSVTITGTTDNGDGTWTVQYTLVGCESVSVSLVDPIEPPGLQSAGDAVAAPAGNSAIVTIPSGTEVKVIIRCNDGTCTAFDECTIQG